MERFRPRDGYAHQRPEPLPCRVVPRVVILNYTASRRITRIREKQLNVYRRGSGSAEAQIFHCPTDFFSYAMASFPLVMAFNISTIVCRCWPECAHARSSCACAHRRALAHGGLFAGAVDRRACIVCSLACKAAWTVCLEQCLCWSRRCSVSRLREMLPGLFASGHA